MSNRLVHKKISLTILGYYTPFIHKLMDEASRNFGSKHRMFNHSGKVLELIELIFSEKERKEALLHILVDAKIINPDVMIKN